MTKRKFRIIRILTGAGTGALGGGLIALKRAPVITWYWVLRVVKEPRGVNSSQ